jgi:CubicO group peptidase (beta-lactamase class C family)
MNHNNHHKWDVLCRFAEEEMRTHHVPGASLGILCGGDTFSAGFGVTNLDNPLPVEPTTLFQIGSITKTFTCAATMRLLEAGRLQLHTPVSSLLPTFRILDSDATSRATAWHLLTHTAGWLGDFFIDTGPGDDALAKYTSRMSELPQVVPVGLHYSYNNAAFALLGRLLELVEEKPFDQIITHFVFKPAALTNCYFKAEDVMVRRFAVGHRVQGNSPRVATPWALPRCVNPMGGIVTNLQDLILYARLMLGGGKTKEGEVLKPETVAAMQAPQANIWRDRESIGLAWHMERHDGQTFLNHGGATLGQVAYLEYCPERAFALVLLTNSDTGRHMVRSIRRRAFAECLGIHLPEEKPIQMTTTAMKEIEGRYVLPRLSFTEIRILAGKLVGQDINIGGFPTEDTPPEPPPPPYTLELVEPDRLVIADGKYKGTTCDILRDESGEMKWFRIGGRIHMREPIPQY